MLKDVNVVLQEDSEECIQNTDSTVGSFFYSLHIYLCHNLAFLKIHACICFKHSCDVSVQI